MARVRKNIMWEQSKRLITGSLVVLTPTDDMYQKKAIVATVAARPLSALQQNPPEVDLFIAQADDIEIDPAREFVMIEERSGFYEADRHTLLALQHMMQEPFPLAKHLVGVASAVSSPRYVKDRPMLDLSSVLIGNDQQAPGSVDVLNAWPKKPQSSMDESQLEALRRILTKQLALVQGPPGTGKTHVSVQAIKAILNSQAEHDPPVIIACQTNHAVDQILRHIASFEPDFVRLGGRSKDQEVIKKRTLYAVRQLTSENPPAGCMSGMAKRKMRDLQDQMQLVLAPLEPGKGPLNHRTLENLKLLSKAQADSLELGASKWVQATKSNLNEARSSPFFIWLGEKLVTVPPKQKSEEFGFEWEEADLEFEQLKELEAEDAAQEDEDFETLRGPARSLADNYTCRKIPAAGVNAKGLLTEHQNMWDIKEKLRPGVYRYLQTEMKQRVAAAFREQSKMFNAEALKRKIGGWEMDENILKKQRIIGMTTTGLSKYRALIAALQPKVVLIEEAAETLEAPVTVACVPSLQHLILVGDHQQLRPHTHVKAHEDKPYYLNVSLFERLVKNNIEFSTLSKQRRMIPEIRRVLYPIYKNLITDHPSVSDPENRPNIPGMGGVNSVFFTHQWPESRDSQMSCVNKMESDMIVGFVEHLAYNGFAIKDITVLCFYNGQRKEILSSLRQRIGFPKGMQFIVKTVDSYQGEENKVVILSLTRSNERRQIGFLDVDNRVCVALSRAQCGFYIFGNGMLLYNQSKTWELVISIMAGKVNKKQAPQFEPNRLTAAFPTRCSNHNRKVEISHPDDWAKYVGGCDLKCRSDLLCGHPCPLLCHPMPHTEVNCQQCPPRVEHEEQLPDLQPSPSSESSASKSSSTSWESYAMEEAKRIAGRQAAYVPHSQRSSQENSARLLDIEGSEQVEEGSHSMTLSLDDAHESPARVSGAVEAARGCGKRKVWKDVVRIEPLKPTANKDWSKERSLLDE